jgi:hypothetical protein
VNNDADLDAVRVRGHSAARHGETLPVWADRVDGPTDDVVDERGRAVSLQLVQRRVTVLRELRRP